MLEVLLSVRFGKHFIVFVLRFQYDVHVQTALDLLGNIQDMGSIVCHNVKSLRQDNLQSQNKECIPLLVQRLTSSLNHGFDETSDQHRQKHVNVLHMGVFLHKKPKYSCNIP